MSRRGGSEVVVIMWRDIPAQINGKAGADKHQVILPHRFQKAIDRAAMVAGKKTAQEYVGEWRRTSYPLTTALAETVDAKAFLRELADRGVKAAIFDGTPRLHALPEPTAAA